MTEESVKNSRTAEHYRWGDGCDGWRLLDRADLSVIQEQMPPQASEVRHYHRRARQLFYVLQGELQIEVGEQCHRLWAGDSLEVAPGQRHLVCNRSSIPAMFLVVSAPTTAGDRVESEA